jgi:surfactin synthase thioesterase subunit
VAGGGINTEIDPSDYYGIIREIGESIEEPENTVLIGFSEGAQFALDLAQRFTNIRGVVAISPSYAIGIPKMTLISPVVLITSPNDDKVMKKYADKWKKHIKGEVTEIKHFKGHKVYLPLETRQIIKMKLRL